MNIRYQGNKNLVLLSGSSFEGLAINGRYSLSVNYLERIKSVLDKAVHEHARLFIVRFDLHLPRRPDCNDFPIEYETNVISRFFSSLTAQINADLYRKINLGKRVHSCPVRYVWVKERHNALQDHYHVALFLNHDTYFTIGSYQHSGSNLGTKIVDAWTRSLWLEYHLAGPLVHFPIHTPFYVLDKNAANFNINYQEAFHRLSYLAKVETKLYGDKNNSFGCSRK